MGVLDDFLRLRKPTPATRFMKKHSMESGDSYLYEHEVASQSAPSDEAQRLAGAILAQAFRDIRNGFEHRDETYRAAWDWIMSDDPGQPMRDGALSFLVVCAILGANPAAIRRPIRRWKEGRET